MVADEQAAGGSQAGAQRNSAIVPEANRGIGLPGTERDTRAGLRTALTRFILPLLVMLLGGVIGVVVLGGPAEVFGVVSGDGSVISVVLLLLILAMSWQLGRRLFAPASTGRGGRSR